MSQFVIKTKISPPHRRNDVLRRERVVSIVRDLLAYRLTLVIAPAGYGKTSLLVDVINAHPLTAAWYSIDILDEEPSRFFAHFVAALTRALPGFGHHSRAVLESYTAGHATIDQLLITVVNELYDIPAHDFVLVLDDYHLVDGIKEINSFLSRFIEHVGDNCHVVLSSRKLLSLPNLALLVARAQVGGLDAEDLAFSPSEVQELLTANFGYHIDDAEAATLVSSTEGWITGLLLSAQTRWPQTVTHVRTLRAAGVDLYDYLAQQVLDRQRPELRDFLMRTALLEEFDAALCATILGEEWRPPGATWQELVEEALTNSLFVLPVGEEGEWLRYHRLFQEFLQYRLGQERPDEERAIMQRLAHHLTTQRQWERARQFYQRLHDEAALATLIAEAGPHLFRAGRTRILDKWIAELPARVQTSTPNLLALRGVALVQMGEVDKGLRLLNQSIALMKTEDGPGLAQTYAWRSVVYRLQGDYARALADADLAHAHVHHRALPEAVRKDVQVQILKSRGTSQCMLGNCDDGVALLNEALVMAHALDDAQNVATLSADIAMMHMNAGRLALAQAAMEQAGATWRGLNNMFRLANVLNNLGVLYHQQAEYQASLAALGEALELAQRIGYRRVIALIYASLGDLFLDLQAWQVAQICYGQAYALSVDLNEHFLKFYVNLRRARLASLSADPELAFEHLDQVGALLLDRTAEAEWGLYHLAMGQYYVERGDGGQALNALRDVQPLLNEAGNRVDAVLASLYLAAAQQLVGDEQDAVQNFSQALAQLSALETRHSVLIGINSILPTLETIPGLDEEARALLQESAALYRAMPRVRRTVRYHAPHELISLLAEPAQLSIQAFGRAEILLDGRQLGSRDWKTAAARNLLYCLLMHDNGLTREQVGALFWPDCSPNQLHTRFKNSVYRLRSGVHQEVVQYRDDVYHFNAELDYQYDVEEFLDHVQAGESCRSLAGKIDAYRAAIDLYRGPYLPDVDETWAWVERERLERIYGDILLQLGRIYFEDDQFQSALELSQQLLTLDSCNEDAHRLSMQIHAAMGNRAGIVRQFQLCERTLLAEIDAPPSPQTEALFRQLMR